MIRLLESQFELALLHIALIKFLLPTHIFLILQMGVRIFFETSPWRARLTGFALFADIPRDPQRNPRVFLQSRQAHPQCRGRGRIDFGRARGANGNPQVRLSRTGEAAHPPSAFQPPRTRDCKGLHGCSSFSGDGD